jgi:RHS repeat-associated protein
VTCSSSESDYRPQRWSGFWERYRFTGKESDTELGLAYFGARYYSPALNRWMSADPLAVHAFGADPNPYAYVGGNVLSSIDPLGLGDPDETPRDDDKKTAEEKERTTWDSMSLEDQADYQQTDYEDRPYYISPKEDFGCDACKAYLGSGAGDLRRPDTGEADSFKAAGAFLLGVTEGVIPGGVLTENLIRSDAMVRTDPTLAKAHAIGLIVGGSVGAVIGVGLVAVGGGFGLVTAPTVVGAGAGVVVAGAGVVEAGSGAAAVATGIQILLNQATTPPAGGGQGTGGGGGAGGGSRSVIDRLRPGGAFDRD